MQKRADLEKKLKDYLKLYPNEYDTINAMIKFLNTYFPYKTLLFKVF